MHTIFSPNDSHRERVRCFQSVLAVRGWGVYMGIFMEGGDIQRVVVTLHRCIILKTVGAPPPRGRGNNIGAGQQFSPFVRTAPQQQK